jgi:DNA-binding SARP family transcriptional activator
LLRRWLGSKAVVRFAAGTYQLSPQLELVADVRSFDGSLARAHGASEETLIQALTRAVELYRAPLLADVGWPWVDPLRQMYQARYVSAALQLADVLSDSDPVRSDGLAEQVLAADPENETAYERLLRNARARGDRLAVQRIVRRYEEAAERLGLTPNPALLRVAR